MVSDILRLHHGTLNCFMCVQMHAIAHKHIKLQRLQSMLQANVRREFKTASFWSKIFCILADCLNQTKSCNVSRAKYNYLHVCEVQ